jgi:CRISPR-associated protein Csm4
MAIFQLDIRGPLHQGVFTGINREAALDWVPSDSLFAALADSWAQLRLDVGDRLKSFQNPDATELPFQISSAFPRAGPVRFYPSPPILPAHSGLLTDEKSRKKAKVIRWISESIINDLIAGHEPGESTVIHGGSVWLTRLEHDELENLVGLNEEAKLVLWKTQIVPHVTIDRQSNASNLFHAGRVSFGRQCGLWFAARGRTQWVEQALPFLADAGLGGMRSTGHGAFSWEMIDHDLPSASTGWGYMLSRYAPATQSEIILSLQRESGAYKLVVVGGWCKDDHGHPWRRRAVRLVAEGALLPVEAAGGKLVDVRPDQVQPWNGPEHIYRYGYAFFIPAGKMVEVL